MSAAPATTAAGPRSILITGCSSGIGANAAVALKARGWRVFASCRQEEDCQRLRAEGFASPRLDYTDAASIDAAGRKIEIKTFQGTCRTVPPDQQCLNAEMNRLAGSSVLLEEEPA